MTRITAQKPDELIIQIESVSTLPPHVSGNTFKLYGLTNYGRLFEWAGQEWQLRSNGVEQ